MGTRRLVGRLTRGRLLVALGLAAFVVGVYVVVVLGGGVLIGSTESPSLPLSILATAAVALLFAPVQAALESAAARATHGGSATPYRVLSRFSETLLSDVATEDLPARMAMLLARGTGVEWAQVWLSVSGELTLAATWPDAADDDRAPPTREDDGVDSDHIGRRTLTVRHGGQLLGVLRLQERPGLALTSVEAGLFNGLAAQAGLVLRLVTLRAELEIRRQELMARGDELRASRERLIEAQDAERRNLERDMHDGAQQHLVALAVHVRLAQTIAVRSPERAAQTLAVQADAASVTIEMLSSLSRGIYPRLLSDEGLVPALRYAVADSPLAVSIDADGLGPLPQPIESALYFCCMEAVQNAVKHSGAQSVLVQVREDEACWRLSIVDNGSGFDHVRMRADGAGSGLANMRDRLDAVGGSLDITWGSGGGTTVTAVVPRTEGVEANRAQILVVGKAV